MGLDVQLYFINKVEPKEIAHAIKQEFSVVMDMSNITLKQGVNKPYLSGYMFCEINNTKLQFFFMQENYIHGGERDGTNPDTLSLYLSKENVEILEKIAKYFGAWLHKEGDDEEDIFIKKSIEIRYIK
jgi:hypothetical protein